MLGLLWGRCDCASPPPEVKVLCGGPHGPPTASRVMGARHPARFHETGKLFCPRGALGDDMVVHPQEDVLDAVARNRVTVAGDGHVPSPDTRPEDGPSGVSLGVLGIHDVPDRDAREHRGPNHIVPALPSVGRETRDGRVPPAYRDPRGGRRGQPSHVRLARRAGGILSTARLTLARVQSDPIGFRGPNGLPGDNVGRVSPRCG